MEKNILITRRNSEALGRYFLSRSIDFALEREFGKSYEFLREGLDIITCHCNGYNWREKYTKSDKDIFVDMNVQHSKHHEYYFVKAFILSFESDPKVLYQALDAIDRYVFYYNDEYGLYVKSRIHMALGNKAEAAKCLFDANMTTRSPLLLYRLGRLKEQEFSRSGVVELYDSFVSNPSSGCCLRCLKKSIKTNNIKLQLDVKESNPLILSFVTEEDEWKFYTLYEKLLNHDAFDDLCPPFGEMSPIIDRFIRFLHENESLFHKEDVSYDEDSNLDHYRHPYDSPYYNDSLDMDQQSPEFWDSL